MEVVIDLDSSWRREQYYRCLYIIVVCGEKAFLDHSGRVVSPDNV